MDNIRKQWDKAKNHEKVETNSGKVGKMKDKFRKGGGEFRKNHRISDPKGGIFLKVGFCLKILRFKY